MSRRPSWKDPRVWREVKEVLVLMAMSIGLIIIVIIVALNTPVP